MKTRCLLLILLCAAFVACQKEESALLKGEYDGPWLTALNVETLWSDSAVVRVKMKAPKQLESKAGDREFPEGLYLEFYETGGNISSVLTADTGYFDNDANLWRAVGNVVIQGNDPPRWLYTDELFWDPSKERVYNQVFCKIIADQDTLMGTGLEAKQDFSDYKILEPQGVFSLEEEEAQQPQDGAADDDDEFDFDAAFEEDF